MNKLDRYIFLGGTSCKYFLFEIVRFRAWLYCFPYFSFRVGRGLIFLFLTTCLYLPGAFLYLKKKLTKKKGQTEDFLLFYKICLGLLHIVDIYS